MNTKTLAVLALLAAFLTAGSATPALAQADTAVWGSRTHWVTGMVGGQLNDLGDQFDDFGANFKKEIGFGARYQYNFTERWAAEGSFLYTPTNVELIQTGSEVSVDTSYYNGNVVFNILPGRRFQPYVTGGAGIAQLDVQSGGDTENQFAGNFGGGVSVFATDRIAFRFDARDYIYAADSFDATSMAALNLPADFDETINDLSINFGVSIGF